ncbi:T9SS type A sorting domain-containing protein [Hymenobacter psychrotolerans]|nr:T9SS type A sorting domain-containing protein [Hymenobacter psychrotolerans]
MPNPAGPPPAAARRTGRWLRRLPALAVLGLLGATAAHAQTVRTLPGDYASLAAAVADLNTAGVPAGGVTINVAAGYTESAINLTLTATGTSSAPIVFRKVGTGANPLVTAASGSTSTTLDAIIKLVGADYVTFDGIDLAESATNTTTAEQAEFGYALFRASATDGAQFNVIRNCVVTLNKANPNTIGIYGANSLATASTALAVTSAAGTNSGNKVYGNVVSNAATGIQFSGSSAAGFADADNEIGGTAGNTVGNFGSTASAWGVGGSNQVGFRIVGNTINSTLNYTSATASTPVAASTVTSTLRGIYTPSGTSANIDITSNVVTVASGGTTTALSGIENSAGSTPASNTVNITNNTVALTYTTATSATVNGINNGATPATVNMTGNSVTATLSNTGTTYLLYNNTSAAVINVLNNQISNVTRTGASGSVYCYYNVATAGTGTHTVSNTTISNVTVAGTSALYGIYSNTSSTETQVRTGNTFRNITAGTGTVYGLHTAYGSAASQFNGNIVRDISAGGTIYGMYFTNTGFAGFSAFDNTISGLSSTGTSSTVYGISASATTTNIYRNRIFNLSGTGTSALVYGLYVAGGTTSSLYNNLIGDLRAPAATGLNAVVGLFCNVGTTINASFNTIYLNASSSGATFGTSGVYLTTTPTTLNLRNNIVVNKSVAAGTGGYTAALRRVSGTAGTVPANLGASTNNNLYYAGTPSATNLLYVEGTTAATNAKQTIADYKAFAAPRESNSVTEDVAFVSTTGTDATYLHINTTVPTQVESGGVAITDITSDFDGDTRNATAPDLGADEGTFTPQDLSGPTITYTALGTTSATTNRTLDVTITDASGIATGANAPRLYYRKGTSGAYVFVNATSVSGSVYTFTFDFAAVGGVTGLDVVQYYVAAQDNAAAGNISSGPVGASGNNPPGTAFSGTPSQFFIQGSLSGVYYVGTGTSPAPARTFATLTVAASAYNNNNLSGAVTFALLDATYSAATGETFPVVFNANTDASANHTLTIRPNTGVTASVTGSASATAVLQLNGADYVTIDGSANGTDSRDLTLTSTTPGTSAVVWLTSLGEAAGATYATIKNLNIVGGNPTSSTSFGIYAAAATLSGTGTGADNDNLVIQNNVISTAYSAIYARGTATGLLNGLQVSGNQIGSLTAAGTVTFRGIDVVAAAAPQISQNRIVGMVNTTAFTTAGIELGANVANAVVSRNYISGLRSTNTGGWGAYGISISSTTNTAGNEISNNMISDIITDGDGTSNLYNPFGIRLAGGTGTKVYYNSVNLTGAFTGTGTTDISAALLVTTSSVTGLDLRNNVLANSISGGASSKSYALYATTAASFGTINHNDYYVSGNNGVLAYIASDKATLADVRTATSQDANSVSSEPMFTSATDLHVSNSIELSNAGTPVSVTIDFDGETRSATTPDLGADEFAQPLTSDLAAVALVAPATGTTCYSPAETVTVTIRSAGGAALDFATTPATVSVVVTLPSGSAQTFTTTLNTGTLAAGTTQNVTLPGTLDMTAIGTYTFAVSATMTGDVNPANDLLAPAPTRVVVAPAAGVLAAPTAIFCVSGTASLTLTGAANGSVQLQQSTDNLTFTDISGATGTTFTTPVLTQTTYYRALVSCNSNVATSNVLTVTVTNPQVTATNSPVAVCEGSTATLTATAATGTTLRFFDVATGGTPLTSTTTPTGATFTTPALTASQQFYVEGVSSSVEVAGRLAPVSTSNTSPTNYGLVFTARSPFRLISLDVYPAGVAGNLVIQVQDNAGVLMPGLTATVAVPAGNGTVAFPVALNFDIPAGTGLRLIAVSGPALVRESTLGGFPYTSPSGNVSVTNGYISGNSTSYYYFYNWQVTSECISTRTPIQVNVSATPTASLPATASTCANSAYQLAGTVGGSATTGTYTSTGTGTFSPNATTLNATYTPSAADAAAGSVTITLTTDGTVCAPATAQTVLTITTAPAATFSYANATYCAGATGTAVPVFGTGAMAGTFSASGTGLVINATTGAIDLSTSAAGTYTVTNTIAASGSCTAATATFSVTINARPAQPTVSPVYNGATTTLSSSSATGNQWYLNGVAIAGATSQTYVVNSAAQFGSYTVVVTNATTTCASLPSAPLLVNSSLKQLAGASLSVYPNPTTDGHVTVELSGYANATELNVYNAVGQLVLSTSAAGRTGVQKATLDMRQLPAGVYLLRARTEGGLDVRRITKE